MGQHTALRSIPLIWGVTVCHMTSVDEPSPLAVMSDQAVSLLSIITALTAMMSMAECPRSIVPISGGKPFLLLLALRQGL